MSDLESGLNYMLRHEIPRVQVIKGENLGILKTWLNVLAKVRTVLQKKNKFKNLIFNF